MPFTRRDLIAGSVASVLAAPVAARAQEPKGLDAARFGVRANADSDQTRALQKAIDEATRAQQPLWLAPGRYRSGPLRLGSGARIVGARGATHLQLVQGPALFLAQDARAVTLEALSLDGGNIKLGDSALISFIAIPDLRLTDCTIVNAGGNAVALTRCTGAIEGNSITNSADNALFSLDGRLMIRGNAIAKSGNGGIRVWQSAKRHDGSVIENNTIEDTQARGGGDGQNGNAINVYRAEGVIVRGNTIRRAAFTAVRGNAASHIVIRNNQCFALGEVAIYSEFDFVDATIVDNTIDTAAVGIAVTNMDQGGHLAVVRGNVVRNLINKRPQGGPDSAGVGIGVEADTTVSGNVIENAPTMGIEVGSGKYLRDCKVTANTVRDAGIGVGVSVVEGAGRAEITANVFSGIKRGAVVGMAWDKAATGDLTRGGAEKFPQLTIADNKVT
ncbi:TIGR03808 family TAT-translocated repetitive protein [Undibacter mobilis]|uniref:TIGR03808 family TAT-translocated repetitive protein n=1 Tax=Undibacter mobilis TaxID=2292256 RepID=A0A371B3N8_9BRAD|nr:TIGR03808 family TAT-translocated repetitive protein [Undibacter mobilis]RDV02205.1 TIGR03808 family TAT-translocated repetitive protein [Undibacter mobilis]